jgi:3-methyladenine DNA glycosylase AlkC
MPTAEELLGRPQAEKLSRALEGIAPRELPRAARSLEGLALRERADLLRDALLADVPGGYGELAAVVRRAASSPDFSGWLIWPVTGAVAQRAVEAGTPEAFDDAMALLAELTGRLSAEFALRTLLRHDLDRALDSVSGWVRSPDEHVRRLASEGTRPYLPWAVRVPEILARPGVTIPVLDALHRDGSEYVRRSVANHLNDLSRDQPDLVVEAARRWMEDPAPTTPALERHGLRTLVKRGHPGALGLLGFTPAAVDVDGPFVAEPRVPWGGEVRFTATVHNPGPEPVRLAIDYVVHHQRANGALTAKVFKLVTRELAPAETLAIDRAHSFRALTTRRYYPGAHALALQVNGVITPLTGFELLADPPDAAAAAAAPPEC